MAFDEPDELDEALADTVDAQTAAAQAQAQAQAQTLLDTVNLDELVAPIVDVALMERQAIKTRREDGTEGVRYVMAPRVAQITLFPSVGAQLKALAFSRKRASMPMEEQVGAMLACLLEVWRESEPDMTLERLQRGLDMQRISKLFQMLFTPPSRP